MKAGLLFNLTLKDGCGLLKVEADYGFYNE